MLSLLLSSGRVVLISRSVSAFHHVGYAHVLALISRIFSVGGMAFDSSVARRESEGLMYDVDDEGVDDIAG